MTTKPMAWQEQGPVSSLDKAANEHWVKVEEGKILSRNSPLQHKKAPKAEPEEDLDFLEPEAQIKTPREEQTLIKTGHQESTSIGIHTHRKTQEQVSRKLSWGLQSEERHQELADLCEDAFTPSPSLCALSTAEYCEKDNLSLVGEVAEWINDVDAVSDPAGHLTSPDSQDSEEWLKTPEFVEPIDQEVDSSVSEEMTGGNVRAEGNVTHLNFLSDDNSASRTENMSQPSHYFPSDNSDDANSVTSPPFADESEEEETVSIDIMSCQQQWNTNEAFLPPHTASPSSKQQEGLLPQRQYKPAPRGINQEAAQQVLGQSSPPLWNVTIEPSNEGTAAFQDCVVAVRERHSRAGESTERENEQTGGQEGQRDGGLEMNRPAGQQHRGGLLRYSQTVQTQEHKTGKYSSGLSLKDDRHPRMESDSCDDSQSDSGVSTDFSPHSTSESTTAISTVSKETPIEREIRRAIEREHSLRRSRGLPNLPTSPEYVEIPLRKTVLCQSLPAKSEKYQIKDREFAGKKMQHEIYEDTQREKDLVQMGKVLGFYDKGTVRQIKERKQIFEAFQIQSDAAIPSRRTTSWSSANDGLTLENQEDMSSEISAINSSCIEMKHNMLSPTQGPNAAKGQDLAKSSPQGPRFSEGAGNQVVIRSSENNFSVPVQRHYHTKPETVVDSANTYSSSCETEVHVIQMHRDQEEEEKEEEVEPKENPFFKLRSSTNLVKVKQDILEAQERERELRQQRLSLYGGSGGVKGGGAGGGKRPVSMEGMTPIPSPSENGLVVPDTHGSSSRGRPSAPRQSVSKTHKWPPAQTEEEKINQPEVFQSPRTPRRKTPLVQHWETGLVNGYNKDDD